MEERSVEESKQILVAIAKLEENTKNLSKQVEDVLKLVSDTATTKESLKSAHKRIDDTDVELEKLKDNQKWTVRTVGGAIIVAVLDKLFLGG